MATSRLRAVDASKGSNHSEHGSSANMLSALLELVRGCAIGATWPLRLAKRAHALGQAAAVS